MHVRVAVKCGTKTLATWQRDYPDRELLEKGAEIEINPPSMMKARLKGFQKTAVIKKFQKGMNDHAFLDLEASPLSETAA